MESARYQLPFSPSDWRIQLLIKKHGMASFAAVVILLEAIWQNNLSLPMMAVESGVFFTEAIPKEAIAEMIELGIFQLLGDGLVSDHLISEMEKIEARRESWRKFKKGPSTQKKKDSNTTLDNTPEDSKDTPAGFQLESVKTPTWESKEQEQELELEQELLEKEGVQGEKKPFELKTIEPGSLGNSKNIHETAEHSPGTTCEAKTRERKGALIPAIPVELFSNDNEVLWRKFCNRQKKKVDADRAEFIFKKFLREERFCNPEALNFALENAISGGWTSLFPRPPDWTRLEKVTGPDGRTYEVKSGTKRNLEKLAKLQAEEDAANEQKRNTGSFD